MGGARKVNSQTSSFTCEDYFLFLLGKYYLNLKFAIR